MKLSITTNFPDVQRQIEAMKDGIARQATASAVNKVVAQAKTAMGREIRAEFNISAAKVNESLRVTRATAKGGLVDIEAALESPRRRGRSLNLINFSARQTAKGVTFKIKRNGPRKLIPGAFIANDGRTVFIRVGKRRLPIKALQTVDVASMFNTRRVNTKVLQMIEAKFPDIFANEARFFTNRFNGSTT